MGGLLPSEQEYDQLLNLIGLLLSLIFITRVANRLDFSSSMDHLFYSFGANPNHEPDRIQHKL